MLIPFCVNYEYGQVIRLSLADSVDVTRIILKKIEMERLRLKTVIFWLFHYLMYFLLTSSSQG